MESKRPMESRKRLDTTSPALENTQLRRSQLLQSFHFSCRRRVDEIASRAACFEELAETFPGLLFALATNYGTAEARRAAVAHLTSGSRLREAANALGLPWWMRKLPPQAFTKRLETLPNDPKFSARIVNLLPTVPAISAKWFERVTQAYRICGPEFALWVARHDRFHAPLITDPALPYVAAWAWFADHPETLGGQLLRRPWTPNMSPRRAFDEVTAWRKRIRLALTLSAFPKAVAQRRIGARLRVRRAPHDRGFHQRKRRDGQLSRLLLGKAGVGRQLRVQHPAKRLAGSRHRDRSAPCRPYPANHRSA